MQTGTYNHYLLNAVHKLAIGASSYLPIENMDFMFNNMVEFTSFLM